MQRGNPLAPLAGSAAAVVLVTAAIFLLRDSVPVLSLGSLYVLAVLPVAILWGRFWAVLVAIASMLAFNFFFLEPVHTFRLSDRSNWLALAVYLATAIAVSELAARARQRAAEAEQREQEEALLGELSVALLQGESLVDELPRIGSATGSVLGVEGGSIQLGDEAGVPDHAAHLPAGHHPEGELGRGVGWDPPRSRPRRPLLRVPTSHAHPAELLHCPRPGRQGPPSREQFETSHILKQTA